MLRKVLKVEGCINNKKYLTRRSSKVLRTGREERLASLS